jgi:hypothetical protein
MLRPGTLLLTLGVAALSAGALPARDDRESWAVCAAETRTLFYDLQGRLAPARSARHGLRLRGPDRLPGWVLAIAPGRGGQFYAFTRRGDGHHLVRLDPDGGTVSLARAPAGVPTFHPVDRHVNGVLPFADGSVLVVFAGAKVSDFEFDPDWGFLYRGGRWYRAGSLPRWVRGLVRNGRICRLTFDRSPGKDSRSRIYEERALHSLEDLRAGQIPRHRVELQPKRFSDHAQLVPSPAGMIAVVEEPSRAEGDRYRLEVMDSGGRRLASGFLARHGAAGAGFSEPHHRVVVLGAAKCAVVGADGRVRVTRLARAARGDSRSASPKEKSRSPDSHVAPRRQGEGW